MEKKSNDKWQKGDINIYSTPIYPDDEEGFTESDILHSSKYSMYIKNINKLICNYIIYI